MRSPAMLWLTLAVVSCSSSGTAPPEPAEPVIPEAGAGPDGLRLTNPTDQIVYYAAFEREWAEKGLFIWAQCTDKPRCRSIPPRATIQVPLSEVSGYFPGAREAQVYYWRLVPASKGGYRVTDLRTFVVPF